MGQRQHAICIHQQEGVVVLAKRGRADVADQQGHAFAHPLGLGIGLEVMALGGKTHAEQFAALSPLTGRHTRQNVRVFHKRQGWWQTTAVLLDFLV